MVQCAIINSHRLSVGVNGLTPSSNPMMSTLDNSRRIGTSIFHWDTSSPNLMSQANCASNNAVPLETPRSDESQVEKSCRECLYTGVATCTGLSLYFMKLASEIPDNHKTEVLMRQATKQKNFLLGGSALWAACGVYRIYLDWRIHLQYAPDSPQGQEFKRMHSTFELIMFVHVARWLVQ
jgi:hypothetical protein